MNMQSKPNEIISVSLSSLRLDLRNYRVPLELATEEAALEFLFDYEDALSLATEILQHGYYDNELPIVSPSENSFLVLEGNRRVGALKSLKCPMSVPKYAQAIDRLITRHAANSRALPDMIRVFVSPDRVTAEPFIGRLHSGRSKRAWNLDQQGTFYFSLFTGGVSVAELKAEYPSQQVVRKLRMATARRFLKGVKYYDPTLTNFAASTDLYMSSLEYAYKHPEIADATGLVHNSDGLFDTHPLEPEAAGRELDGSRLRALEHLLNRFRDGSLNTRSHEFRECSDENRDLIRTLQNLAEIEPAVEQTADADIDTAPGTSQTSSSYLPNSVSTNSETKVEAQPDNYSDTSAEDATAPGTVSTTRGPNSLNSVKFLPLEGIEYRELPTNLRSRFQELRSLDFRACPLAAAIALRAILETSIKYHFEHRQQSDRRDLKEVFTEFTDAYKHLPALKNEINRIGTGSSSSPGSIYWFNLMAHGVDSNATPTDILEAWSRMSGILRHIVNGHLKTEAESTE